MIQGQGLVYKYPGGNSISFPNFEIVQGSQWLVLGPSGSGKTTLLQLLAGLRQPILKALGLDEKWNRKPSQLSQGERQRVSLARALAKKPKVILADEPTAALDDLNTNKVIELLKAQAKSVGATLIIVTHDQRLKSNFSKKIELS